MVTRNALYLVLTLAVLALIAGPIGIAVFVLGFGYGDSPCVLCWAQRTGMLLIALTGLFVIRYGPRPRYLGMAVLIAAAGVYMGLRHSSLHLWRDVGQGFSVEVLGAHTYTWSMFIYWICLLLMGTLLLLMKDGEAAATTRPLRPLEQVTMGLFLMVTAANAVQALASTGPPPFMGQSDPIRFSFHPRQWLWSTEEWAPSPVSLRGRWAIEKPNLASVSGDPTGSPLGNLPSLPVKRQTQLSLPLTGSITDLGYDATSDRFLLTTQHGVYLTDGTRILRHTVVDPAFAVDLATFTAGAFLDASTVLALAENKSYVILRENDQADAAQNFRFFLESFDKFEQLSRSRLTTVRAKMMYVMSAAFDPASASLYTVTVPNARMKKLVVSRFDRRDMTLSQEFTPSLAADSGLAFKDDEGSLDSFYVTGAAFAGGRLLALSAAHSTLLAIDLASQTLVAAYAIPGLARPTGIAVKGRELLIVNESGVLTAVDLPGGR